MANCNQCKKPIEKPKKFCDKDCYRAYLKIRASKKEPKKAL